MRRFFLLVLILITNMALAEVENIGAAIMDSGREKSLAYQAYLKSINQEDNALAKKLEAEAEVSADYEPEFTIALIGN